MLLPKIFPQPNELLGEVLLIIAARFVIRESRILLCLLSKMTATQVTVDKNFLFILQSFSLNMLHIYVTLNNFTTVKKCIIQFLVV